MKGANNYLNVQERWESEGRITLQRSNVLLNKLKDTHPQEAKGQSLEPHPQLLTVGISMLGFGDVLS